MTTTNNYPIYTYNGLNVLIIDEYTLNNNQFEPIIHNVYEVTEELLKYISDNDIDPIVTTNASYDIDDDGDEIEESEVRNFENPEILAVEIVSAEYARYDEFVREFVVTTSKYDHKWKSTRTIFLEQIAKALEDDNEKELAKLEKEWDELITNPRWKNLKYDYTLEPEYHFGIDFEDLVEEAEEDYL